MSRPRHQNETPVRPPPFLPPHPSAVRPLAERLRPWPTWAPRTAWPVAPLIGMKQPVGSRAGEPLCPGSEGSRSCRNKTCWLLGDHPGSPEPAALPGILGVDPWLGQSVQGFSLPANSQESWALRSLALPSVTHTQGRAPARLHSTAPGPGPPLLQHLPQHGATGATAALPAHVLEPPSRAFLPQGCLAEAPANVQLAPVLLGRA